MSDLSDREVGQEPIRAAPKRDECVRHLMAGPQRGKRRQCMLSRSFHKDVGGGFTELTQRQVRASVMGLWENTMAISLTDRWDWT